MNPFYFAFQKQKVGKSVQTIQLELSPNTHFTSIKQSQDSELKGLAGQLKVIFLKVFKICFILFFVFHFQEVEEGDFSTLKLDHPDDHSKLKEFLRIEGLLDSQLEVIIRLVVASATRPPEFTNPYGRS